MGVHLNRLLVVDDDSELCSLVTKYLAIEGFQVDTVNDGEQGIRRALSGEYALIILDIMLPGINGFDVLRQIRIKSQVPVLMLSAHTEDTKRIVSLEIGADDYLSKPFNPHELVARIRAIIRRSQPQYQQDKGNSSYPLLTVGDIELDKNTWKIKKGGNLLDLTALEFNLLETLLKESGNVVTREILFKTVLDRELDPFDRSLDTHVSNLRKKLGSDINGDERIKTVRGVGYIYQNVNVN